MRKTFLTAWLSSVSEAYSVREARIHVRRLRDLMSTSFESNANSAADNLSHSFSVAVSGVEIEGKLFSPSKLPVFLLSGKIS